MNIVPVIFEDHQLAQMRPLAWSTPVFELRCGMFSTRERIGLCSGSDGGILLGRAMLQDLHNAAAWRWGAESVVAAAGDGTRFLFINGNLAPDFTLIQGLLTLADDSPAFLWRNEQGLVAALLDYEQACRVALDWKAWDEENAGQGRWSDPSLTPRTWPEMDLIPGGSALTLPGGGQVVLNGSDSEAGTELAARFDDLAKLQSAGPAWIWDLVRCTAVALASDLSFVQGGVSFRREPFGIFPGPEDSPAAWANETTIKDRGNGVFCGEGVVLAPGTAIDTAGGPVILDRGVRVMPHCYLEGPLYIGPGSLVKPGTRIFGESSFGIVNRLSGEIGESTFGDFANKQHDGFIGHAVLGSWINLGAMTTCSDLKNNYGEIRVDLGAGAVGTGNRFIGLLMGDHAKTAIGTLFNTGTSVGFASNIFGADMPPKFVGNFQWGGQVGCPRYAVDRARSTAEVVMSRRGCHFTDAHGELFNFLGG